MTQWWRNDDVITGDKPVQHCYTELWMHDVVIEKEIKNTRKWRVCCVPDRALHISETSSRVRPFGQSSPWWRNPRVAWSVIYFHWSIRGGYFLISLLSQLCIIALNRLPSRITGFKSFQLKLFHLFHVSLAAQSRSFVTLRCITETLYTYCVHWSPLCFRLHGIHSTISVTVYTSGTFITCIVLGVLGHVSLTCTLARDMRTHILRFMGVYTVTCNFKSTQHFMDSLCRNYNC